MASQNGSDDNDSVRGKIETQKLLKQNQKTTKNSNFYSLQFTNEHFFE